MFSGYGGQWNQLFTLLMLHHSSPVFSRKEFVPSSGTFISMAVAHRTSLDYLALVPSRICVYDPKGLYIFA